MDPVQVILQHVRNRLPGDRKKTRKRDNFEVGGWMGFLLPANSKQQPPQAFWCVSLTPHQTLGLQIEAQVEYFFLNSISAVRLFLMEAAFRGCNGQVPFTLRGLLFGLGGANSAPGPENGDVQGGKVGNTGTQTDPPSRLGCACNGQSLQRWSLAGASTLCCRRSGLSLLPRRFIPCPLSGAVCLGEPRPGTHVIGMFACP